MTSILSYIIILYLYIGADDIMLNGKVAALTFVVYLTSKMMQYISSNIALYIEAQLILIAEAILILGFFRINLKRNINRYYKCFLSKPNIETNITMNQVIADPHGYYVFMEYIIKEFCVGIFFSVTLTSSFLVCFC